MTLVFATNNMHKLEEVSNILPSTCRILSLRDIGFDSEIDETGKTLEDNYAVMRDLSQLQLLGLPVLVGVSRKRMVWQLLDIEPEQALNGTTVLNTMALERGAKILRVHDVRAAVECVRINSKL